ncbi:MAG: maltose ABC transporter permease MalF [Acidimicrobiia bacterium]|nr:maltose ABC transporter permease MalF [Acidimicrobiia bacterium]
MKQGEPGRVEETGLSGPSDPAGSPVSREERSSRLSLSGGTILKLLFLAAVNAIALASIPTIWTARWWAGLIVVVGATLLLDIAYLTRRAIPLKYLIPGTIFALIFQVVPVVYSGYIAFTNYGTGNVLTKEQVLDSISTRVSNVPGATRYQANVLAADGGTGEFALLLTDDAGNQFLGTPEGLQDPGDIVLDDAGKVTEVDGYSALALRDLADRQDELQSEFEIPTEQGVIRVVTATSAALYEAVFQYDEASDTVTNIETGITYTPVEGNFVSSTGEKLTPGWVANIGWKNFSRIFTSQAIRGPFVRVFLWNYAFALLSVLFTFVVGLGLAMTLNHPTMRGKKIYRSFLIFPYALPAFLTALVWAGMLNQEYGVVNDVLSTNIPWLRDPWMAKLSVLLVNLWLGFPYMFLITTGALQAIPEDLKEAAFVDGATPRQAFRRITFPLLLVSVAPLLIASFAFNFNNFNIIYLLNGGGPPIAGAQTPAGHTDILISYTYRLAFEAGSGSDFGFASAIAIMIFIMVATISALSFRRTRALEDLA